MQNESSLKSSLRLALKLQLPGFVALRHEDVRTSGIPDLSLTGCGRTTWWEFKHTAPGFKGRGIQELTMLRLSAAGYARYVMWEEKRGIKRTLIVHPKQIGTFNKNRSTSMEAEAWCTGFDNRFIVEFMRKAHGA